MTKSQLEVALPKVANYFEANGVAVLSSGSLRRILDEQREEWGFGPKVSLRQFASFLEERSNLKKMEFPFPHRAETRYTWGDVGILEVLMTVKPGAYCSHHTAAYLHGLTSSPPQTIYINHEQKLGSQSVGGLTQGRIEAAFARPARKTTNVINFNGIHVCLLNGKNTGQLGVIDGEAPREKGGASKVRVTNLERTLIDLVVRPDYSGGIAEVAAAYERAKGRVSIQAVATTLAKLGHSYPYHQSVGYLLERAGYEVKDLAWLRGDFPMDFDFYLCNQMRTTAYVKDWRLFVPESLE